MLLFLCGSADAHIDDDLVQPRQRMPVLAANFFGQRGQHLLGVFFLEAGRRQRASGLFFLGSALGTFLTLLRFGSFLGLVGLVGRRGVARWLIFGHGRRSYFLRQPRRPAPLLGVISSW